MTTLGIIVGNRGFFPDRLCESGRKEILQTLEKLGIGTVILPEGATKYGSVESLADAQQCADLFAQNAGKIDGILVTLPNFGDERGVANAIRWSGLNMPVLVHAFKCSACETDIMGAVAMVAMAKASGRPSALVDWNNNYGEDPDKGVIFHCSNLPKDVFVNIGEKKPVMDYQAIIAGTVGKENTYGTIVGRVKAAPFTYLRATTEDHTGKIRAYVGEGEITDDPLETFGGYGVVRIPNFQKLLTHICENGFEHHVAVNPSSVATGVKEALGKYLGWDVYHHV